MRYHRGVGRGRLQQVAATTRPKWVFNQPVSIGVGASWLNHWHAVGALDWFLFVFRAS